MDGSLLVKKGQAKPSVGPVATDPASKKVSRFPNPETIADVPLTSTPPIGELYGSPEPKVSAPAPRSEPVEPVVPSANNEQSPETVSPLTAQPNNETAGTDEEVTPPEPRLVFLLPRPSLRLILSLVLIGVMGASAWYLMNSPDTVGTQRLATIGPAEDAASDSLPAAENAISPPPSGAGVTTDRIKTAPKARDPAVNDTAAKPAASASNPSTPIPSGKPGAAASDRQYAIQLLATKSLEAGQAAWTQIFRKHGDQLDGLSLDLQTVTLQGRGEFVRVRAGPISQRQVAIDRCKALSSAGQDCLVVRF